MGTEIERKFLVDTSSFPGFEVRKSIEQAYIDPDGLEIRVRKTDQSATLNLKSAGGGLRRIEQEFPIDPALATELMDSLGQSERIRKTRHVGTFGGKVWEVDVFDGKNRGLVLAEIELQSEDESFESPPWVTREVTGDPAFTNAALAKTPLRPDLPNGTISESKP